MNASPKRQRVGNLVVQLSAHLRELILKGEYKLGEKLPSEAQLTAAHGVSRTVVRETIAALRADGLVEARQGAGVFVIGSKIAEAHTFHNVDHARVSSVIEMLEFRMGVETEAAGLAAIRRSPQQEEEIISFHHAVLAALEAGKPTAEADFGLHIAIAKATNNPRFPEFLSLIGKEIIPRAALQNQEIRDSAEYLNLLHNEHGRIVDAILSGDEDGARHAMHEHLRGSVGRYRALRRRTQEIYHTSD